MRTYAEIIARRLLKRETEKQPTIGNKIVKDKLDKKKYTEPFMRESLDRIKIAELSAQIKTRFMENTQRQEFFPAAKFILIGSNGVFPPYGSSSTITILSSPVGSLYSSPIVPPRSS